MRIRAVRPLALLGPRGKSMGRERGWNYVNQEAWVISAVVESLLLAGCDASGIHIEMQMAPGCQPDLVYVTSYMVLIYEAKSRAPRSTDRKQVARYVDAARKRWPDRFVSGYLVWPRDGVWHPRSMAYIEWSFP